MGLRLKYGFLTLLLKPRTTPGFNFRDRRIKNSSGVSGGAGVGRERLYYMSQVGVKPSEFVVFPNLRQIEYISHFAVMSSTSFAKNSASAEHPSSFISRKVVKKSNVWSEPGPLPSYSQFFGGIGSIPRKISGFESNRSVPLSQFVFRIEATSCSRAITPLASSPVIRV